MKKGFPQGAIGILPVSFSLYFAKLLWRQRGEVIVLVCRVNSCKFSAFVQDHPVFGGHPVTKVRGDQGQHIALGFYHRIQHLIFQTGKTDEFLEMVRLVGCFPVQQENR